MATHKVIPKTIQLFLFHPVAKKSRANILLLIICCGSDLQRPTRVGAITITARSRIQRVIATVINVGGCSIDKGTEETQTGTTLLDIIIIFYIMLLICNDGKKSVI